MPTSDTIAVTVILLLAIGAWIAYRRYRKLLGNKGSMEVRYTHLGWDDEDLYLGGTIEGTLVLTAKQSINVESVVLTLSAHREVYSGTSDHDNDNTNNTSLRKVFERELVVADKFSVPAGSVKTLTMSIPIPTAEELNQESILNSFHGLTQDTLKWKVNAKVDTPGLIDFYDQQSVRVKKITQPDQLGNTMSA